MNLPWEKVWPFNWMNLNPHHLTMLYSSFVCNLPSFCNWQRFLYFVNSFLAISHNKYKIRTICRGEQVCNMSQYQTDYYNNKTCNLACLASYLTSNTKTESRPTYGLHVRGFLSALVAWWTLEIIQNILDGYQVFPRL